MIAEHNVRMVGWIRCTVLTKDPAFTLRTNLRFGGTLNRRKNVVPGTVSHRKEGDAPLVNRIASRPLFYDISAHLAVRHSRILNIYDQRIIVDSSGEGWGKGVFIEIPHHKK